METKQKVLEDLSKARFKAQGLSERFKAMGVYRAATVLNNESVYKEGMNLATAKRRLSYLLGMNDLAETILNELEPPPI